MSYKYLVFYEVITAGFATNVTVSKRKEYSFSNRFSSESEITRLEERIRQQEQRKRRMQTMPGLEETVPNVKVRITSMLPLF